jgi:hypothetical protein
MKLKEEQHCVGESPTDFIFFARFVLFVTCTMFTTLSMTCFCDFVDRAFCLFPKFFSVCGLLQSRSFIHASTFSRYFVGYFFHFYNNLSVALHI